AYRFVSPTIFDRITRIGVAEGGLLFIRLEVFQNVVLFLCPRLAAASYKPFSPNKSRAEDRDILEIFTPDQAIVPMCVPKILIFVPGVRFWRVIFSVAIG